MAHSLLPYLLHAKPPLHLLATLPFFSQSPLCLEILTSYWPFSFLLNPSERHIFTLYTKILLQQFILCYPGTLLPAGGQKQDSQVSKALSCGKIFIKSLSNPAIVTPTLVGRHCKYLSKNFPKINNK